MNWNEYYKPSKEDLKDFNETNNETTILPSKQIKLQHPGTTRKCIRIYRVTAEWLNGEQWLMQDTIKNIVQAAAIGIPDYDKLSRIDFVNILSTIVPIELIKTAIDPELSETDWTLILSNTKYPYINNLWNRVFNPVILKHYNDVLSSEPLLGHVPCYPIFSIPYSDLNHEDLYVREQLLAITKNVPLIGFSNSDMLPKEEAVITLDMAKKWLIDLFTKLQVFDLKLFRHLFGCVINKLPRSHNLQVSLSIANIYWMMRYFGINHLRLPSRYRAIKVVHIEIKNDQQVPLVKEGKPIPNGVTSGKVVRQRLADVSEEYKKNKIKFQIKNSLRHRAMHGSLTSEDLLYSVDTIMHDLDCNLSLACRLLINNTNDDAAFFYRSIYNAKKNHHKFRSFQKATLDRISRMLLE